MKVEAISINQVFLNNRVLKIPFFQRGYVWKVALVMAAGKLVRYTFITISYTGVMQLID